MRYWSLNKKFRTGVKSFYAVELNACQENSCLNDWRGAPNGVQSECRRGKRYG